MRKDLPNLFANKINKTLDNNEKVAVTKNEERSVEDIKTNINYEKSIDQKIQDIFGSTRYVYKADVIIKLKDKTITKKIVGKNKNNLITIDNELISINDIIDIQYKS